jgi:hypothetical protein
VKSFLVRARILAAAALTGLAFAFLAAPASAADPDLDVKVQIVGEEIRAQVSLFVRAPQQRVWEVITDFERAPQYTRDLQVSRVMSRSGDVLRVFQKNVVRYGPFVMPVETVREVRLAAPSRAESRLLGGSIKRYDSTTELAAEGEGTRLTFRSLAIPGTVFAGMADASTVREQTLERFKELRAEILRREHHAAARPRS